LFLLLIESLNEWKNIFAQQADGVPGTAVLAFWLGTAAEEGALSR